MSNTIKALKRAVKAAVTETMRPRQFAAGGKPVVCQHCGSNGFERYNNFITGKGTIGFAGYALACCECSHLEYFAKKPTEIEAAD